MNRIIETKEDVILYKKELEELLASGLGSQGFLDFLEINLQMVKDRLDNIEAGDYAPHVKLAYNNLVIFEYLAVQRINLRASIPSYKTFEEEQNASQLEHIRNGKTKDRISAIDRELDELAEPLKDDAFEILLKAFKAVQDYKTNTCGIKVEEDYISDGEIHIGDKVHIPLIGFKKVYLWFHCNSDFPQLIATDENDNNIIMRITDDFSCEITNADSKRDQTSGWLGSHLWNPGGYGKICQILGNLNHAIDIFAFQRNPEAANKIPLTFEQREIAKVNAFRYYPMSSHGLSEKEKCLIYRMK